MPRPYPAEFRARAIALVRAGKPAKDVAFELRRSASENGGEGPGSASTP